MLNCVDRLVEVEKAVVEGAGACGLAAILAGLLPELKGERKTSFGEEPSRLRDALVLRSLSSNH